MTKRESKENKNIESIVNCEREREREKRGDEERFLLLFGNTNKKHDNHKGDPITGNI